MGVKVRAVVMEAVAPVVIRLVFGVMDQLVLIRWLRFLTLAVLAVFHIRLAAQGLSD